MLGSRSVVCRLLSGVFRNASPGASLVADSRCAYADAPVCCVGMSGAKSFLTSHNGLSDG